MPLVPLVDFLTYGAEVTWRLMRLPVALGTQLEEVRAQAATFQIKRSGLPLPGDLWEHGEGFHLHELRTEWQIEHGMPALRVEALLGIVRTRIGVLECSLELYAGSARRRTRFRAPPETNTPCMLSVDGPSGDAALAGTVAVVDGVISAGDRLRPSDFMRLFR